MTEPAPQPARIETNTDQSGYGPCVEAARNEAGNITDGEVERCLDEHLQTMRNAAARNWLMGAQPETLATV